MRNYKRFDRHEIFKAADTRLVMDVIREVPMKNANYLYGLFDGYLYDGIKEDNEEFLLHATKYNFFALIDKIQRVAEKSKY